MAEANIIVSPDHTVGGAQTPSSDGGGRASSASSSSSQNPPGSAGSGKRVAVTPLSGGSSSEGEYSDFEDHIPPSPSSSTSSGPIYVRPPGFTHHGQEIQILKVKHRPQSTVKLKKKVRRQPLTSDSSTFMINIKKEVVDDDNETIHTIVVSSHQPCSTGGKIGNPRGGGCNSGQSATPKIHVNSPRDGPVKGSPREAPMQQQSASSKINSPRGGGGGSVMSKLGITGTKPKPRKGEFTKKGALKSLCISFWFMYEKR